MKQVLLFPDPCPLVERLGLSFFRELPEGAGVYLMKGAADKLLYVGKAKNLRKRLGSYRVANPDRMPRRHLRMLRAVERIDIQECADERAALEREAQLLRTLRPPFNRAGTWPGNPKYFAWKLDGAGLHLTVTGQPGPGWKSHGPIGGAVYLRATLVRLLWGALCPERGFAQMPAGWFRGEFGEVVTFNISADIAAMQLEAFFSGGVEAFVTWVLERSEASTARFDQAVLAADFEYLT